MSHARPNPSTIASLLIVALAIGLAGCGSSKTTAPAAAPPDLTPPQAPTGLAIGTVWSNKFSVTWTPNSEADLAGYKIYLYDPDPSRPNAYTDVTMNGLTTTPAAMVAGTAGRVYIFRVTAVDASSNESAMSDTFTYTFSVSNTEDPMVPGDGESLIVPNGSDAEGGGKHTPMGPYGELHRK